MQTTLIEELGLSELERRLAEDAKKAAKADAKKAAAADAKRAAKEKEKARLVEQRRLAAAKKAAEDLIYLTAPQVRKRYGGVSEMSLWRWGRRPDLKFPIPIKVGQQRLYSLADLEAFEAEQMAKAVDKAHQEFFPEQLKALHAANAGLSPMEKTPIPYELRKETARAIARKARARQHSE